MNTLLIKEHKFVSGEPQQANTKFGEKTTHFE